MAPTDNNDDTQSDSQTNDDLNDTPLSRRGLMAAGGLAGLGAMGAGLAGADDQGSGSGDANTVDGHHANEFLHVDGSETATGDLNLGGNYIRNAKYWIPGNDYSRQYTNPGSSTASVGWWDDYTNEEMLEGFAGGNIEAHHPFRAGQISETRVVGPGDSEFNTIEAAINDLPADNTPHGLPMGHVHVVPGWDSTQESTWPIEIRGNIAVTGGGFRKGTEIRPPNGEWAFVIDGSDDWTGSQYKGYRTNKESVYLKGFDIRERADGDDTTYPYGGIRVDGGIEHVIEDINIRDAEFAGIYFTGEEHTFNGDTKKIQTFSNVVRDVAIRAGQATYGIRSDPGYENNDLHFNFVKVKYADESFSFKGGGTVIQLHGCAAEEYSDYGLRAAGTSNVHWSGGYMEVDDPAGTSAFLFTDYVWEDRDDSDGKVGHVDASGSITNTYVNGADQVLVTNYCNAVHVANIIYHRVNNNIVHLVRSSDDVYISPSTIVPYIASTTEVPLYKNQHEQKIRVDGTRAWHDISSSGVTGNYPGDSAYHNGADGNERGLYVWDPNAGDSGASGAWVGPNGSEIDN